MTQTKYEDPCEKDGLSCEWIDEDYEDEFYYDTFCLKCYRSRDWSKEEFQCN